MINMRAAFVGLVSLAALSGCDTVSDLFTADLGDRLPGSEFQ